MYYWVTEQLPLMVQQLLPRMVTQHILQGWGEREQEQQQVSEPRSTESCSQGLHYGDKNSSIDIPAQAGAQALRFSRASPIARSQRLDGNIYIIIFIPVA